MVLHYSVFSCARCVCLVVSVKGARFVYYEIKGAYIESRRVCSYVMHYVAFHIESDNDKKFYYSVDSPLTATFGGTRQV